MERRSWIYFPHRQLLKVLQKTVLSAHIRSFHTTATFSYGSFYMQYLFRPWPWYCSYIAFKPLQICFFFLSIDHMNGKATCWVWTACNISQMIIPRLMDSRLCIHIVLNRCIALILFSCLLSTRRSARNHQAVILSLLGPWDHPGALSKSECKVKYPSGVHQSCDLLSLAVRSLRAIRNALSISDQRWSRLIRLW